MGINPDTTVKKIIYLPKGLWETVETWRFANRVSSEAEAIRRLLRKGLEASLVEAGNEKGDGTTLEG